MTTILKRKHRQILTTLLKMRRHGVPYMYNVASLFKNDAANLYKYWNEDYKGLVICRSIQENIISEQDKASNGIERYRTDFHDKCAEIANEAGSAKIGDPLDKYNSGDKEGALLCRRIMV